MFTKSTKKLVLILITVVFAFVLHANSNHEIRKNEIMKLSSQPISKDQVLRKSRSHKYLREYEIKINESLPVIGESSSTSIRTKEEVLKRIYPLTIVAVKGEGLDQATVNSFIDQYKLNDDFSEKEVDFIYESNPSQQNKINAVWRYEALNVLLWAVGMIDELEHPSQIVNAGQLVALVFPAPKSEFERKTNLVDKQKILDELDLIYRMHWACVDARINGEKDSLSINCSIVYERHYALNWLVQYMNQNWDDISTDT